MSSQRITCPPRTPYDPGIDGYRPSVADKCTYLALGFILGTAPMVMGRNFLDVMKALCEGRLEYADHKR